MRSPGRSGCPRDERLVAAFLRELDQASEGRIAEHVAACPLCRKKQDVLAGIADELRARTESLPDALAPEEEAALRKMARSEIRKLRGRGRPDRPARIVPAGAVAGAVLVAAAAAGLFFYLGTRTPDAGRGAAGGIRLIEPAGDLDRMPVVFRWDAVKNADTYAFEVFDDALRSVLTRRIKSASVMLAPEETDKLAPGRTYYWDVEAFDDEGRRLSSGRSSFNVAPRGAADPGI